MPELPANSRRQEGLKAVAHGYQTGQFTLASGKTSTEYLDLRRVLLDPFRPILVARAVLHKLWEVKFQEFNCQVIAGPAVGACPLISAVQLVLNLGGVEPVYKVLFAGPPYALYTRKDAKGHGLKAKVDGLANLDRLAPSRRQSLVLEDVATTGASALECAQALQQEGVGVLGVLAVVDRQDGAADLMAKHKLPFWPVYTLAEVRQAAGVKAAG